MAFVYMLECSDGSFYVGSTVLRLEERVHQHQEGLGAAYTARRRPVRLLWHEEHEHIGAAFAREKQIQNWGRAKRIALIERRYDDLPALAQKRGKRRSPGLDTASPSGSAGSTTEQGPVR